MPPTTHQWVLARRKEQLFPYIYIYILFINDSYCHDDQMQDRGMTYTSTTPKEHLNREESALHHGFPRYLSGGPPTQ